MHASFAVPDDTAVKLVEISPLKHILICHYTPGTLQYITMVRLLLHHVHECVIMPKTCGTPPGILPATHRNGHSYCFLQNIISASHWIEKIWTLQHRALVLESDSFTLTGGKNPFKCYLDKTDSAVGFGVDPLP